MNTGFQERRRLFPDVRLELSNSGICVDFGPFESPASMQLADPSDPLALYEARASTGTRLFRRPHPDTITSHDLIALANLCCEVEARRGQITQALDTCRRRIAGARLGAALLSKSVVATSRAVAWKTTLTRLTRTEADLAERLDATALDLDTAMSEEMHSAYLAMVDAFRDVVGAESTWRVMPGRRYGSATPVLKPVRFAIDSLPLFRTPYPAICLGLGNGGALFLMPGFLAVRRPGAGLALIEWSALTLEVSPRRAINAKRRPWRNGGTAAPSSPHGEIEISSASGFRERFVVSDWPALQAFRHKMADFQEAMSHQPGRADTESAAVPYSEIPDLELPAIPALPRVFVWESRGLGRAALRIAGAGIALCGVVLAARYLLPTPAPAPPHETAAAPASAPPVMAAAPPTAEAVAARMPEIVTAAGPAATSPPERTKPAPAAPKVEATARTVPMPAPEPARPDAKAAAEAAKPAPVTSDPPQTVVDQVIASMKADAGASTDADRAPAKSAAAASTKKTKIKTKTAKPKPIAAARGLSEAEVSALQDKLYALGYYNGPSDGRLDGSTVEAFNAWRSEVGRPAVRTVGRAEYRAFLSAISR